MIGVSVAVGLGFVVRALRRLRRDRVAVEIDREITVEQFVEIVAVAIVVLLLAIAVVLIGSMPEQQP